MWWHCNEVKERETAFGRSLPISIRFSSVCPWKGTRANVSVQKIWDANEYGRRLNVKLRKIRKKSGMAAYWWWFDDKRHNGRILLLKVNPNREKNIHSNAHVILFLFLFIFITHLPLVSPYLFLSLFSFISLLPCSSHLLCPWGR